jgi:pyruvate formate lyase activating enzyme
MLSLKPDDKFIRKALFTEKVKNNAVQCRLCPHNCTVAVGHTGICKVRMNIDGELYTTTYGNPCSLSIDPIEKKPLYHFLPGTEIFSLATAGCNFRCLNCQNHSISQTTPDALRNYDLSPEAVVEQAKLHRQKSIAFTYTEPTIFYEYMLDTAKIAQQAGIKTVIVSNGYINREPLTELCNYIDAANIDLKSINDKVYRKLTGGSLQPVLDTILTLKKQNVWVEITRLLIPEFTDDLKDFENLCLWLVNNNLTDTPLHISRFFPNYKLTHLPATPVETLIKAEKIAKNTGLQYVYLGNVYNTTSGNTYCPNCGNLLVERHGYNILTNKVVKNKCYNCGTEISGIWVS